MRAQIYTNIGKSQIEDKGSHFKITGIPITKNQSVMNRVAYTTEHNEKGIPTIEKQPITTGHPLVNGVNVSAKEGEGLNFYTGSLVGKSYLDSDDKWKVDTMVNKKKLAAQDTGERWMEILTNRETFGVSTGLTFAKNDISGVLDGKEYDMVAMNQEYDHLAFLDPKVEKPAGGSDTMVSFNSDVEVGEVIICNIDEDEDEPKPIGPQNELIENDNFIDKLANKLKGLFANDNQTGYNNTDLNTNHEAPIMDRTEMLEALGLATNSQVTDDELKTLLKTKLAANASEVLDEDKVTSIVEQAVNAAVKPLQDQLTANADKELSEVAEQVAALNKGLDAEDAKALGLTKAKAFLAANSAEYVADYAAPRGRASQVNSDADFQFTKPGAEA